MLLKQSIPEYLTTSKNTIIQIAFTTIFAYVFINIYRPFGYDNWYEAKSWELLIASAIIVLTGMIVIIVSRVLMLRLKKSHEITFAVYIWFIVAEIIFMGVFYTSFEILILNDTRTPLSLLFNAVQNTSLILLIPYALTILFFAWKDIKKKFDSVAQQFKAPTEIFIPFKDEKGTLKVTIKCIDLLYLESNDNYVNIHYIDKQKERKIIIRNTLKKYEKQLQDYPIYRVHRKFSVNIKNVKLLQKGKKGYELVMNTDSGQVIPVSISYQKSIMDLMKIK
ncbi:MAG TPA: LytTR family transcriptional regulator DNA-binding domain-containing protein [Prolixibacteraceae bacterium]|nr:LytTR family transcriptional regulator DNA-binding domain-containing protein [Prolixibacteraceae bacterium]